MIVDTSALVAIGRKERHFESLLEALLDGPAIVPAPVLVEFYRVVTRRGALPSDRADAFMSDLISGAVMLEAFTPEDARLAAAANTAYGRGNGRGGTLNLLDLMLYAMARRMGRPILCTGGDFAPTDAAVHPASRD